MPVIKCHHQKINIREVRIDYSTLWQKTHWKAIESAYGKSPFFLYFKDDLFPFFNNKHEFLFDLNQEIMTSLLSLLEVKMEFKLTTEFNTETIITDLRESIHPKSSKKGDDSHFHSIPYYQCFSEKHEFIPNLSILDLLFNEGNMTVSVLKKCLK